MNPADAKRVCEEYVERHVGSAQLDFAKALHAMVEFYREQPAVGCTGREEGDMLLCEWSESSPWQPRGFWIGISRQFVLVHDVHDKISQLNLNLLVLRAADDPNHLEP